MASFHNFSRLPHELVVRIVALTPRSALPSVALVSKALSEEAVKNLYRCVYHVENYYRREESLLGHSLIWTVDDCGSTELVYFDGSNEQSLDNVVTKIFRPQRFWDTFFRNPRLRLLVKALTVQDTYPVFSEWDFDEARHMLESVRDRETYRPLRSLSICVVGAQTDLSLAFQCQSYDIGLELHNFMAPYVTDRWRLRLDEMTLGKRCKVPPLRSAAIPDIDLWASGDHYIFSETLSSLILGGYMQDLARMRDQFAIPTALRKFHHNIFKSKSPFGIVLASDYFDILALQASLEELLITGMWACNRLADDSLIRLGHALPNLRRVGLKAPFLAYMPRGKTSANVNDPCNWIQFEPWLDDEDDWLSLWDSIDDDISNVRHPNDFTPITPRAAENNNKEGHKIFNMFPASLEELQIEFGGKCDDCYDGWFWDEPINFLGRKSSPKLYVYYIIDDAGSSIIRPSGALFDLLQWVTGMVQHSHEYFPRLKTIWAWQYERRADIHWTDEYHEYNITGPWTLPLKSFEEGKWTLDALQRAGISLKFWKGEFPPALGLAAARPIVADDIEDKKMKFRKYRDFMEM